MTSSFPEAVSSTAAGNPWFSGDIGIRGDSIAAMGSLGNASASLRIDAKGFVVSPGFIDIHSHARRGILVVPSAENYIRQGVTTAIEGPDGSSPLPIAPFLDRIAQTKPVSISGSAWAMAHYATR